MFRKGNCMNNGAMENFFGRLKSRNVLRRKFESVNAFINELKNTFITATMREYL